LELFVRLDRIRNEQLNTFWLVFHGNRLSGGRPGPSHPVVFNKMDLSGCYNAREESLFVHEEKREKTKANKAHDGLMLPKSSGRR
jgi:hypothetical protein